MSYPSKNNKDGTEQIYNFKAYFTKSWFDDTQLCHQYIVELHGGNRLIYTILLKGKNADHCQFGEKVSDTFEIRHNATDEQLEFMRQAYKAHRMPATRVDDLVY